MFLHIGGEHVLAKNEVIAIFDIENTTISKITKDFLKMTEEKGQIINVLNELPKSFILTNKNIYISPISPSTLFKRAKNN